MTTVVERARKGDLYDAAAIVTETFNGILLNAQYTPDWYMGVIRENRLRLNVAKDDGLVVGALSYKLEPEGHGLIQELAVHNEYRQKGIGTQLVKASIRDLAKAIDAQSRIIVTKPISDGAVKIFQKQGFKPDWRYGNPSETYYSRTIEEKELPGL
jgi:ribosomal protein S18 acetylase RimI-like enzyme